MNTAELIRRAENAARTGQPLLATLYMRRALERNREDVKRNRREWAKSRPWKVLGLDLIDAFRPFTQMVENAGRLTQQDFALVPAPLTLGRQAPPRPRGIRTNGQAWCGEDERGGWTCKPAACTDPEACPLGPVDDGGADTSTGTNRWP